MKMLLYVLSLGLVMSLSPCIGEKVAASPSVLVYSVYLENGTVINISNDAANFEEIDFQVMNYLNNISNRMERYVGRGILEEELNGTKYLVIIPVSQLTIKTNPGLNPDVPLGWTIDASKIVIKLQKDVLGEERIFVYSEDGSNISPWSSAASVDTINL